MLSKMGSFWKYGKAKKQQDQTYPLKRFRAAVLSIAWRVGGLGAGAGRMQTTYKAPAVIQIKG